MTTAPISPNGIIAADLLKAGIFEADADGFIRPSIDAPTDHVRFAGEFCARALLDKIKLPLSPFSESFLEDPSKPHEFIAGFKSFLPEGFDYTPQELQSLLAHVAGRRTHMIL